MSLKKRNAIVPQMIDYDQVGDQWVPYLMLVDRPNRSFSSVSTNEYGFRTTLGRNGSAISIKDVGDSKVGIILGSSAVFGVGATNDRYTIPSILNQITDELWLNYGVRAFNSTQELLLFLLYLPSKPKRIVLFSGVNNITLAFLAQNPSPVYNSFFYQTMFERTMANPPKEYVGVRPAASQLIKELRRKFSSPVGATPARASLDSGLYDDVMTCFRRDLRSIKALSDGLGAQLCFALQPMATWIEKSLSSEEENIFSILDGLSQDWQVLSKNIGAIRDRYFDDVQTVCSASNIPFYNLNRDPAFSGKEWLFVDRVHLTDKGYALSADILKREFGL